MQNRINTAEKKLGKTAGCPNCECADCAPITDKHVVDQRNRYLEESKAEKAQDKINKNSFLENEWRREFGVDASRARELLEADKASNL